MFARRRAVARAEKLLLGRLARSSVGGAGRGVIRRRRGEGCATLEGRGEVCAAAFRAPHCPARRHAAFLRRVVSSVRPRGVSRLDRRSSPRALAFIDNDGACLRHRAKRASSHCPPVFLSPLAPHTPPCGVRLQTVRRDDMAMQPENGPCGRDDGDGLRHARRPLQGGEQAGRRGGSAALTTRAAGDSRHPHRWGDDGRVR